MRAHQAANRFPELSGAELRGLVDSMRAHGYDVTKPIVRYRGEILDGRNRLRAASEAGVEPAFIDAPDDCNPYDEAWKHNGARRDLEPGQKAAIRALLDRDSADFESARAERRAHANRRRSETQKGVPKAEAKERAVSREGARSHKGSAADVDLAARAGVSEATAGRVHSVAAKSPELLEKVAAGEVKLAEATRQLRKERLAATAMANPTGTYRVIYADPPWQYGDNRAGLAGYEGTAAADHYPTMPTRDICALPVKDWSDDNAVLFCWATFPMLIDALEVVRAWGFKYKTAFVWAKGRANQGHYHDASCELLLVATRGSATPDPDKREHQVINVKRDKHSVKPEAVREMIDRLYTYGRKLEMFRRGAAPKGWDVWGNEATLSNG